MQIKKITGGLLESNGYILYDYPNGECTIIDPGYNSKKFLEFIENNNLTLKYILLTHHHYDHSGVAKRIKAKCHCNICLHEDDASLYKGEVDAYLRDGQMLGICGETFTVIHTPGHTKGSCTFLNVEGNYAFSGDALFVDQVGRYDLEDGDEQTTINTICNIFEKWRDDRILYPGHGEAMTMRELRQRNEEYIAMAGGKNIHEY